MSEAVQYRSCVMTVDNQTSSDLTLYLYDWIQHGAAFDGGPVQTVAQNSKGVIAHLVQVPYKVTENTAALNINYSLPDQQNCIAFDWFLIPRDDVVHNMFNGSAPQGYTVETTNTHGANVSVTFTLTGP